MALFRTLTLISIMCTNVDASLRWQKCFVQTCVDPNGDIKCEQSKVHPCLLKKRDNSGRAILLIVCYVDDVLRMRQKISRDNLKEDITSQS